MKTARKTHHHDARQARGLTAIELLVAILILGVLASLGVPAFTQTVRQYRVGAAAEEFIASTQLARIEAIRRGQAVVLRRVGSCDVVLQGLRDWSCGWQVFADANENNLQEAEEEAIHQIALPPGIHGSKDSGSGEFLTVDRFGSNPVAQRFSFFPRDSSNVAERTVVCFNAASRMRKVTGVQDCPTNP